MPTYRQLSASEERQLMRAMRAGDSTARDRLVESQTAFVRHVARKRWRPGLDLDDLVSCGLVALLESLDSFDPRRSRLSTYCHRSVWWSINHFCLSMRSAISRPHRRPASKNGLAWDAAGQCAHVDLSRFPSAHSDATPDLDRLISEESLQRLSEDMARLPSDERDVLQGHCAGHSIAFIAASLGFSTTWISVLLQRARCRLGAY